MTRTLPQLFALAALPLLAACSSNAINSDSRNTFLDADDMLRMTDKMAASFASDGRVWPSSPVRW